MKKLFILSSLLIMSLNNCLLKSNPALDAVKHNNISMVRYFLRQQSNNSEYFNEVNKDGWTAITLASYKGYTEIVKDLLSKWVNPNINDAKGRTALICAATAGHYDIVKLLLTHYAYPNATNSYGKTALMCTSDVAIVKLLLEHDADPYIEDEQGWTPLMNASLLGYSEIEYVLIYEITKKQTVLEHLK